MTRQRLRSGRRGSGFVAAVPTEPRLSSRSPGDRGRYLIEAMQAPPFQRVTRLGATLAKVAVRQ